MGHFHARLQMMEQANYSFNNHALLARLKRFDSGVVLAHLSCNTTN